MLENLNKEDFEKQLNEKFQIHLAAEIVVEAELIEVRELRKTPHNEAFSIFLLTAVEIIFAQNTYKVENSALGVFDLFLVPIEKLENGVKYEALFNRLIK